ncbi:MAG: response regulator transcription factor [Propioniciclava sp.]|uniref:response regulator n=1 Tax=Propioniciclava sp. TaxID=2038686 RepID=UPI0039E6BC01
MTDALLPRPARILIADDLPLFRRAIAHLLDEQPDLVVVGQAGNGIEAIELAQSLQPDIVLLDVEMPVMDGIAAARRLRALVPDARIVMLTVSEHDDHLMEAIKLGAHGYLLKDLHPDELYAMLRAAMRDEAPVSAALVGRLLTAVRDAGRTPAVPSAPEGDLSRRELEVLRLVADGLSNKEIGVVLSITEGTVKNHVHHALSKLGLENRIQAAAYIVRHGLGLPRS